jgi:hypothetical protein
MFIKKIHLPELQNEEHAGLHTYVIDYISEADAETLNISIQLSDYRRKLAIEKSVLDLVQKNTFTARVNTADEARDKPIRGFFKVVKGLLDHFNPTIAQAAYNIDVINENFSDITRLSDNKQSQAFESYITALEAASADITTLELTDWITEMKTVNTAFLDLVKSKNAEDDTKPGTNMKAARVETDTAYNAIANRINAFITINGDAAYASLVTKINGRIDQYNTAIAQRRGHAQKDEPLAAEAKQ